MVQDKGSFGAESMTREISPEHLSTTAASSHKTFRLFARPVRRSAPGTSFLD